MLAINDLGYRVGVGAEQLGGYNWGKFKILEVENAIDYATTSEKILVDTADCYGDGLSEKRLGKIIHRKRETVFLSTKFGVRIYKCVVKSIMTIILNMRS